MDNNVDMSQVAQKLINKLAIQEYNNAILESQVDKLNQKNQQLKQQLKSKEGDK